MAEIDDILSELRHRVMRPVDSPVKHSALIALHRLTHPERDGGVVVEDGPVSELIRRLEEVADLIERNAGLERDGGAAPKRTESVASDDAGQVVITLLFDKRVLACIDAAAKRLGISRADWLHFAVGEHLKRR